MVKGHTSSNKRQAVQAYERLRVCHCRDKVATFPSSDLKPVARDQIRSIKILTGSESRDGKRDGGTSAKSKSRRFYHNDWHSHKDDNSRFTGLTKKT